MVWLGNDLYISTNSIVSQPTSYGHEACSVPGAGSNNSLISDTQDKATCARNCMLSRLPYKGIKIEWCPDECAEALPKPVQRPVTLPSPATSTPKRKTIINRFNLLSIDVESSSGGDSETEAADDASRLSGIPLARSTDAPCSCLRTRIACTLRTTIACFAAPRSNTGPV